MTPKQLRATYKGYEAKSSRWTFSDDLYTGEFVYEDKLPRYLPGREQGENDEALKERRALCDPDLTYATLMNKLGGQLATGKTATTFTWNGADGQGALGDVEDPSSAAFRLERDMDGRGTSRKTMFGAQNAPKLLRRQIQWLLVEGYVTEEDEDAETGAPRSRIVRNSRVCFVPPQSITGMEYDEHERLIAVKVYHPEERHSTIGETLIIDRYTIYRLNGWERYEVPKDAKEDEDIAPVAAKPYTFYASKEDQRIGKRCLPIFPEVLPFEQEIGYLLARKAFHRFNIANRRDATLLRGCTPILCDPAPVADPERKVEEQLTTVEGHLYLLRQAATYLPVQPGHDVTYAQPDMGPVEAASEDIKEKKRELYEAAYQMYSDAVRQKTATEVRQDFSQDVGAFLSFLASTLDDAENRALFLLEQVESPNRPDAWGHARVERPDEYEPANLDDDFKTGKDALYGTDPLPVTEEAEAEWLSETAARKLNVTMTKEDALELVKMRRGMAEEREAERDIPGDPSGDGLPGPPPEAQDMLDELENADG